MADIYNFSGALLSPLHIGGGSDNVLDPLEYVVKDGYFYRINMDTMLSKNETFASAFIAECERNNNITVIRRLILEAFDPKDTDLWIHRSKASKFFEETYHKKFTDKNHQLLVHCMPFAGERVYIPGSSLKGSMRTAVLDIRAQEFEGGRKGVAWKINKVADRLKSQMAEATLLGAVDKNKYDMKHDPFKALSVSDVIIRPDSTEIVRVVNVNKDMKETGIEQFVEVVCADYSFDLRLSLETKFALQGITEKDKLTVKEVVECCTEYFQTALDKESFKFYYPDSSAELTVDSAFDVGDDTAILRVGQFSHIECMTYNDRDNNSSNVPSLFKSKHRKGWGNTRHLVNGKVPLGILKLSLEQENN